MSYGQAHQPRAHGHQHRLRTARRTRPAVDECTGAANCAARVHVHGCLADVNCARCEDPNASPSVPTQKEVPS